MTATAAKGLKMLRYRPFALIRRDLRQY